MVNKNLLQEELKEHIKEGIKPSDLKKLRKNNPPTAPANIPTPPPPPNLVNSESNQQDLLAKIKKLEAKNNSLTKTIQNLKDKQENQSINIGEKKLFVCYNCKLNHNLSLLVLELPEGKLCQDCWKILREKTKQNIQSNIFTCHNCQQRKEGAEYKVKLNASLKEYPVCADCLPFIKEYNEKELDSERELEIWE